MSAYRLMPSVTVDVTGHCPEARLRERLALQLGRLGGGAEPHEQILKGPVRVSSLVPRDHSQFFIAATAAGCVVESLSCGERVVVLPTAVRIRGIELSLGRDGGSEGHEKRVALTFLDAPEWPFFDGRLVQLDPGSNPPVLRRPRLRLEPHLEDWFCLLLSWVKQFLVADLWWHAGAEMQAHDDYRDVMTGLQQALGAARAEAASLDSIRATFDQHNEYWQRTAKRVQPEPSFIGE